MVFNVITLVGVGILGVASEAIFGESSPKRKSKKTLGKFVADNIRDVIHTVHDEMVSKEDEKASAVSDDKTSETVTAHTKVTANTQSEQKEASKQEEPKPEQPEIETTIVRK